MGPAQGSKNCFQVFPCHNEFYPIFPDKFILSFLPNERVRARKGTESPYPGGHKGAVIVGSQFTRPGIKKGLQKFFCILRGYKANKGIKAILCLSLLLGSHLEPPQPIDIIRCSIAVVVENTPLSTPLHSEIVRDRTIVGLFIFGVKIAGR
jgi:hypothetical protein